LEEAEAVMGIKLLRELPLGIKVQKLSITGLRGGNIPVSPSPTNGPNSNPSGDLIPNKSDFRGFGESQR
jgi:hypothetical protein